MSAELQPDPQAAPTGDPSSDVPLEPNKSLVPVSGGDAASDGGSVFSWFFRLFGRGRNGATIREDLADALSDDEGLAQGLSADERAMLTSILHLQETRVEDLMVPRAEIVAVEQTIALGELLQAFNDSGHSRMPVYDETLDDPRGMIHIRDVVTYILKASKMSKAEIAKRRKALPANLDLKKVDLSKPIGSLKLLREVMFIPPSMGARELMTRMQAERVQIALVIDEYGGTDGLVTLEDIVEEIVGDIEDEHDDEEEFIQEKSEGVLICDARAELDDLREMLGQEFAFGEHEEDVDTVGGLIFDLLGRVPVRGEVIMKNGFEFRVIDTDARRIKRVELLRSARRRVRRG